MKLTTLSNIYLITKHPNKSRLSCRSCIYYSTGINDNNTNYCNFHFLCDFTITICPSYDSNDF